jgi:hypothetical protein
MHEDIRHGQHAMLPATASAAGAAKLKAAGLAAEVGPPQEPPTPFNYLFRTVVDDPANRLPESHSATVIAALMALGDAMVEAAPAGDAGNSTVPAIYTYWGQFIDHDVTLTADLDPAIGDITDPAFTPIAPQKVVDSLENRRDPTLELDSVYDGAPMKNGIKLQLGINATGAGIPGEVPPPAGDLARDLPRGADKKALIGDPRNDENLVVAQFHAAFLRFHNAAVDWVSANEPGYNGGAGLFGRARDLTRWHYQWLVVHDYLETLTRAGTVHRTLIDGAKLYQPNGHPFMPLEFSVAAFRFGHSMIRAGYDHNRNFGRGSTGPQFASLNELFEFTGNHANPFRGLDTVPFNWIIEWDRFTDKGSAFGNRFARKIDTEIAPPLAQMLNEGTDPSLANGIRALLKHLAQRNLLRGYLLSLPTGQAVAQAMGMAPLTPAQVLRGDGGALDQALVAGGFDQRTPLWYYILREAEAHGNGNTLGEVGSRIVAETLIGLIKHDPQSYLNQDGGWTPAQGVRLANGDPVVTIRDLLHFAGLPA